MTKLGKRSAQRGGTVVGIIIGLIIGLAIALVVAVVISKSTLPFMNKVAKQDKAPELTAAQAADPNKALYGSNAAAKEAEKDFNAAPAAVPGAVTPVPPNAVAATPTAPVGPTTPPAANTTAKPAAAPVAAAAATAKPDNADDKFTYFLQAGAFRDQADAENSKAKLALAGFEASISDKGTDANGLYRVRIGPFNQLEAMNRVRGKLSDNGIDVAVVRVAK
ncbi:MAG: SPOR domain-containing protein [Burkholderiaceae bacterium]|nr:SPOR domain-containing protein [Burkholderiaceae bacterium]